MSNAAFFMHSPVAILRDLGERIRDRRIAAQLTQGALAKRAGVSRDTVTRVERGENIAVEALIGIAIARWASWTSKTPAIPSEAASRAVTKPELLAASSRSVSSIRAMRKL